MVLPEILSDAPVRPEVEPLAILIGLCDKPSQVPLEPWLVPLNEFAAEFEEELET